MNRRDFLHPRHLAHAAGQVAGAFDLAPKPTALPAEDANLIRAQRRAMATSFEILLPFGTPNALPGADAGFDLIDRLEDQLSVYRDTSEVSQLNQLAAAGPVVVEERLYQLLQLSSQVSAATQGAFDISTGALIKAWGFYRRRQRIPSDEERRQVLACTGMHHIELNDAGRTVRYLTPGLEINLGSIGKGYALDRAAQLLRNQWKISSGLLHGGHSSVYAIGSSSPQREGWPVGIRHPWDANRRLAIVRLRDRALATSAATFQHLEHQGRKLGHILDPRTGWPAETLASATVIAPTAALADALATAFFILGIEPARHYCEEHPDVGAVLLPPGVDAPILLGFAAEVVE